MPTICTVDELDFNNINMCMLIMLHGNFVMTITVPNWDPNLLSSSKHALMIVQAHNMGDQTGYILYTTAVTTEFVHTQIKLTCNKLHMTFSSW